MQSLSPGGGRKTDYDYEHSELLKYENRLMREAGDLTGALDHLEANVAAICDPTEAAEVKARLLIGLGRRTEAETAVMTLLRRNPHNVNYYRWLEEVTDENDRMALYARLRSQLPVTDCLLLQSIAAAANDSGAFREGLEQFIKTKLKRGPAPGLFNSLKFLYKTGQDIGSIIGSVASAAIANAEQTRATAEQPVATAEQPSATTEQAEVTAEEPNLVWVYFLLAQHCDKTKDYLLGLDYIAKALGLEPDLVELHMAKAKLLKHSGQLMKAAEALEQAHGLDPTDRYVGSKCARYLLRAGHTEQAINIMRKYTKVHRIQKNSSL
jgi:peptide alpha-N-acetyltransferase